jgi:hypothetical protein
MPIRTAVVACVVALAASAVVAGEAAVAAVDGAAAVAEVARVLGAALLCGDEVSDAVLHATSSTPTHMIEKNRRICSFRLTE